MGDSVRKELDEYFDVLNQTTAELAALYEYVGELDLKMEKFMERIDALQALVLAQTPGEGARKSVRLTQKERSVLQVLRNAATPLSSVEIGKLVGLTADMVAQVIYCLAQKGVEISVETSGEYSRYSVIISSLNNGF